MPGTERQPSQSSSTSSREHRDLRVDQHRVRHFLGVGIARIRRPRRRSPRAGRTPICGAARPAPFIAAMVSCMSCSSACSSGVPKFSTGFARLAQDAGRPCATPHEPPWRSTSFRDDQPHLRHGLLDDARRSPRSGRRRALLAAAGGGIHHHGDARRSARPSSRASAASGMPVMPTIVGAVALEAVDLGRGLEPRPLRRRVGAAVARSARPRRCAAAIAMRARSLVDTDR